MAPAVGGLGWGWMHGDRRGQVRRVCGIWISRLQGEQSMGLYVGSPLLEHVTLRSETLTPVLRQWERKLTLKMPSSCALFLSSTLPLKQKTKTTHKSYRPTFSKSLLLAGPCYVLKGSRDECHTALPSGSRSSRRKLSSHLHGMPSGRTARGCLGVKGRRGTVGRG